ncbi:MAG: class IV adenylate cyclase [Ignavibacteria bacterium]|nr:class IV adenylate cyclase [Ignavibacteria bacterium]
MSQNLEIKAIIPSVSDASAKAESLGAIYCAELHQVDTYFRLPSGRLKLREINRNHAELIYYNRQEHSNARLSDFITYPTSVPLVLKEILEKANGIIATVTKKRLLYMYHDTRIHIDTVDQLGSFIEFESPVTDSVDKAQQTVDFLCHSFGIKESDFFIHSYIDLLTEKMGITAYSQW